MHIRPYVRADIPACVTISMAVFIDGTTAPFCYPQRHLYPLAFRHETAKKHIKAFNNPGTYGYVCVADEDDDFSPDKLPTTSNSSFPQDSTASHIATGAILGYIILERVPVQPSTDAWVQGHKASLSWQIERFLQNMETWYSAHVCRNPSTSAPNVAFCQQIIRESSASTTLKNKGVAHWYVAALAVLPEAQGKGIGKRLIKRGVRIASREEGGRKVVTLWATPQGRWLYEKLGFRAVGTKETGLGCLRLPGCEPSYCMVWDPEEAWTARRDGPDEQEQEKKEVDTQNAWEPWVVWRNNITVGSTNSDVVVK